MKIGKPPPIIKRFLKNARRKFTERSLSNYATSYQIYKEALKALIIL